MATEQANLNGPTGTQEPLGSSHVEAFVLHLANLERKKGTQDKYRRDVLNFVTFLDGRPLTKEETIAWKTHLRESRSPVTVNSMLSALNVFLAFLHREDCKVAFYRIQRSAFRDSSRDLTKAEFRRLVITARKKGDERLALLLETLAGMGLRVSELSVITRELLDKGGGFLELKGKIRRILIPTKLRRKLLKYARAKKIASGAIFRTRSGKPLTRGQIWAQMKALCEEAGVDRSKVYPHNMRHLFATTYYGRYKDISALADILGHSNIQTTRNYLVTTGKTFLRQMEKLGLVF